MAFPQGREEKNTFFSLLNCHPKVYAKISVVFVIYRYFAKMGLFRAFFTLCSQFWNESPARNWVCAKLQLDNKCVWPCAQWAVMASKMPMGKIRVFMVALARIELSGELKPFYAFLGWCQLESLLMRYEMLQKGLINGGNNNPCNIYILVNCLAARPRKTCVRFPSQFHRVHKFKF